MRRRVLLLAPLTALALAAAPAVADPEPGSPAWVQRDLENMAAAHGRQADQVSNPAFHTEMTARTPGTFFESTSDQLAHPDRPALTLGQWVPGGRTADPYRVDWAQQGRGVATPIEYENRYGARITGTMWIPPTPFSDPVTGRSTSGPFPTVVITTGSIQGFEEMYLWAAQGLAEAGYVVMTYDVQGQGQSETFGHRPDGSLWCAGPPMTEDCPGVPFQQEPNFVEGTEDALLFLLSDANPVRGLVDEDRLGLAGHSLGATAVTKVGNRAQPVPDDAFAANGRTPFPIDVDAVVGWDNISLGPDQAPRVPTMGQSADYFFSVQPSPGSAPDPEADTGTYRRFVDAGVDSMQVALRSSTHLEWTYIPFILPASSEGERVAMHYTLAWMDRYVKASTDGAQGVERRDARTVAADATERLTTTVFDGSADASAIGAGTWDPEALANVPHTLQGEAVADHLSIYHRSAYAFDGHRCDDMRRGC